MLIAAIAAIAAGIALGVPAIHDKIWQPTPTSRANPCDTGCNSSSPEQRFTNDALSHLQTVLSAVNAGTLTRTEIGQYGDNICNLMPQYIYHFGSGTSAFNAIANEFSEGFTRFHITGPQDGEWVSLAIENICPQYVSDIPYGAAG